MDNSSKSSEASKSSEMFWESHTCTASTSRLGTWWVFCLTCLCIWQPQILIKTHTESYFKIRQSVLRTCHPIYIGPPQQLCCRHQEPHNLYHIRLLPVNHLLNFSHPTFHYFMQNSTQGHGNPMSQGVAGNTRPVAFFLRSLGAGNLAEPDAPTHHQVLLTSER